MCRSSSKEPELRLFAAGPGSSVCWKAPASGGSQESTPCSQENVKNVRAVKIFHFTELGGTASLPSKALPSSLGATASAHAADPDPGQLLRKNSSRESKVRPGSIRSEQGRPWHHLTLLHLAGPLSPGRSSRAAPPGPGSAELPS